MLYYRIRNNATGTVSYGACVTEQTPEQILSMCKQDAGNSVVEPLTYNEYQAEVEKFFADN
jgi:hypothetical protein